MVRLAHLWDERADGERAEQLLLVSRLLRSTRVAGATRTVQRIRAQHHHALLRQWHRLEPQVLAPHDAQNDGGHEQHRHEDGARDDVQVRRGGARLHRRYVKRRLFGFI